MFVQTIFVSLLLLLLGLAMCFAGFRFFVILLPVFGFFAGFLVTAQAIQELFGGGFLATVTSWVIALVIGTICAVAAYLFYAMAVAILAATAGYELGVGLMTGLGISSGVLLFIAGLILATALIAAVLLFNLPRLIIIVLSAGVGAAMILAGVLLTFGRISLAALDWGVLGAFIRASWFWCLVFLAIMAAGVLAQVLVPAELAMEPYGEEGAQAHAPSTTAAMPPMSAEPAPC